MADFETTTDPADCRVWSWGFVPIDTPEYDLVEVGTDLDAFFERIAETNTVISFHNLKFDGMFIIDWLLNNDYRHVQTDLIKRAGTFKTLISEMGSFYSITIKWDNGHRCEFRDSLKKLPMPVKRIATSFGYEETKGEIDYHTYRPIGHKLTAEEEDYLRRDIVIPAKALKEAKDNGMTKLTVASDSMAEYKRVIGPDKFKRLFPVLNEDMDREIRRAYRGGFTYADPRFKSRITGCGLVLDVNSLYPAVMMHDVLPYGEPKWVDGKVTTDDNYPLSIFSITFTASLKKDHIPCIQIKGNSMFSATEYLREIEEPTTMMMTNVDWELYNDHYDVDIIEYGGGWLFHGTTGLFDEYITKWGKIKAEAKGGKREIAKLHLNSLYGKFASNPNVTGKIPKLIDGVVKLVRGLEETRPPVYTAMGVFITSYARNLTIRAAQENYDVFAYADTDSLHLLTSEVPTTIEVHPNKMGAWKLEYHFDAAFYIRAKGYVERLAPQSIDTVSNVDGNRHIVHIAGLPDIVTDGIVFDDLIHGKVFHGKLKPKTVPGGVVLMDTPFQLNL